MSGFRIIVYGIILTVAWHTAAAQPTTGRVQIDGGFWQPNSGMVEGFTDESLAQEVEYFGDLGMETIILHYAGRWDESRDSYVSYWPNSVFPMAEGFEGRDPLGAVVDAAEKRGLKVVIGGLLMPRPRWEGWEENIAVWTSREAMDFRREILQRYADRSVVVGWYTPNEYNPYRLAANECDPEMAIEATRRVARLVSDEAPSIELIHSVGLYVKPVGEGRYRTAPIDDLDEFWTPWFEKLDGVGVWMIIDGVGTRLSNLNHTAEAQQWMKQLCDRYGKTFWVDVENADMTDTFQPFTMERLHASLQVAANYADRIVVFDYLHYMSRQSPKPAARRLYGEYLEYRFGARRRSGTNRF